MQFSRQGDVYRGMWISGPQHVLLGLEFSDPSSMCDIVVESLHEALANDSSRYRGQEIQSYVLAGVAEANRQMGTNYCVTRVHFVASDNGPGEVYEMLARLIVERMAKNVPFVNATSE